MSALNVLARIIRALEALHDGDVAFAVAILQDLERELSEWQGAA